MEGTSFAPLLANPKQKWKSAAVSQFHRSPRVTPDKGDYMGLSIVTQRYHFVEWRQWNDANKTVGDLVATDLYDLQSGREENVNIAGRAEDKPLIPALAKQLEVGWKAHRP